MPYCEVNETSLYYETFGAARSDRPPLLLIHGATSTGAAEWGHIAPLLARDYYVIVPDCRGHGHSPNPQHTYRFAEMADDLAALIRALGYERAHIIGHSNGGNVALTLLLEHPDVVQCAVLQAANACVTAHLRAREPGVFDPERIAREDPAWFRALTTYHTALGSEYWRELLSLTLAETLAAPNYAAADLARVQRPVLVIEGADDPVNAPPQHGRFIARAIPDAELWTPAGVAHNVHHDLPFFWWERVLDFLARRGDDANDALYRLQQARYRDARATVFAVRVTREAGTPRIAGRVLDEAQRAAALEAVAPHEDVAPQDAIHVLLTADTPWALVNRAVTDLRRAPDDNIERVSQARLGEAVRILEEKDGWSYVQMGHDGYLGWLHQAALWRGDAATVQDYLAHCGTWVKAPLARLYAAPATDAPLLGYAPLGVTLPAAGETGGFTALRLPDGRVAYALVGDVAPPEERLAPDAAGIAAALDLLHVLIGVPYLWGGRTPFGLDCSGLSQTFYGLLGIRIPRDADQQFYAGGPVAGTPEAGDLYFFGQPGEERPRVTHVGIALGDGGFIHSTGRTWCVTINHFAPDAPDYNEWLHTHCLGVRRFR
ncbi:MAG TPA: alpha/beta fold hydrolase [Anaerolineae bacterium]|nr:alpha/beta fold hydrolase [Anaerolineae bacterium]HQI83905.1 alpha/beta fold hydrolase [Anaerolineae bacterium]